ncbi:hypothetical protein CYLTODRAFT_425472 [Cylindrobasidium torrendii FP15055 ss-10]|uniref:Inhibitor I9 domain-containing protein n=1 Tax=Cylindrobasidium torrendii FP15055 ss-10 TaxID=1314674 RepID=A0A0D7B0X9_9AGAR|nr:hypothetical protein CYLTODRAFT_425472 [Cylindrobasidium torrendii FP15055 ss-10]
MSNQYIITFKDGVSKDQISKFLGTVNTGGGEVVHEHSLISAVTAKVTPNQLQLFQSGSFKDSEEDIIKHIGWHIQSTSSAPF